MSQPPTGPEGYPPASPPQPPAAPGQQPAGGAVYGTPYGGGQPAPQQSGDVPTQQYPAFGQPGPGGPSAGAGAPQSAPPAPAGPGSSAGGPGSAPPVSVQYAPMSRPPVSGPAYGQPMSGPPVSGPAYGQPMSGPPVSGPAYGQPMSAPPVSGPAYGQPMSAPPVSGPGFGQPMSGPPVSGPAYGQPMSAPPGSVPPYGAAAPGAGKGRTVLILAVVAGLLFVLSGVMSGLFVTKNSELDRTERRLAGQVSERDGTIAANAKEMEKLKADLQTVQDKLADTEQDLTGTRNDRDEQARQKKVIATCLDKLATAMAAAADGNKAAFDAANKGLDKVCDEAENYL